MNPILTVGHSNHPLDRFIALIEGASVTAVADVRSAPVSRFVPHFNKDRLATSLAERGIGYLFLGKELGGRPDRPELFTNGVADYEKMAEQPSFKSGIARLVEQAQDRRIALMCAEADPLDCHRSLLIGRALSRSGANVGHILTTGEVITQAEVETRLLDLARLGKDSPLSASRDACLAEAYRARARKVAYAERKDPLSGPGGAARRD